MNITKLPLNKTLFRLLFCLILAVFFSGCGEETDYGAFSDSDSADPGILLIYEFNKRAENGKVEIRGSDILLLLFASAEYHDVYIPEETYKSDMLPDEDFVSVGSHSEKADTYGKKNYSYSIWNSPSPDPAPENDSNNSSDSGNEKSRMNSGLSSVYSMQLHGGKLQAISPDPAPEGKDGQ